MSTAQSSPQWLAIRASLTNATEKLLKAHNLEGWTVIFENVLSRAGQCHYGRKTISYSTPFMLHASAEDRMNTVYHEVAHAITGQGHGHDYVWRRLFVRLGGNGKASSEFPDNVFTPENFSWIGTCPTCKDKTGMNRAPQTVWGCARCPKSVATQFRVYDWAKRGVPMAPENISMKYATRFAKLAESFK